MSASIFARDSVRSTTPTCRLTGKTQGAVSGPSKFRFDYGPGLFTHLSQQSDEAGKGHC